MDHLPQQALRQLAPLLRRSCWLLASLPLLYACSPKTTTPQSRLWQGFITRYNTLYHAHEAYDESYQQLLQTASDDYTRPLPLDLLAYTLEEGQERANFSRTLTKTRKAIAQHSMSRKPTKHPGWRRDPKAVALQALTEYNPALSDAWLLTARALFYSGKLEEAHLTAEGIILRYATVAAVREEARLWAVRSLTLLGRTSQAEELLRLFPQDASTERLRRGYLYPATQAELALAQERLQEALPALRQAAQRAPARRQRARLHFLLGQVLLRLDQTSKAQTAFLDASRLADEPKLELAALLQALRLQGDSPRSRARLLRLGDSRRYRAEQDLIFLALGQSYLQTGEMPQAMSALQRAVDSARQHRGAWAEALLELGEHALQTDRYPEAYQHWSQAVAALSHQHPRQTRLTHLLPGLALLAPVAADVRQRDSLLQLALLPEVERTHRIDSLIRAVRQRRQIASASISSSAFEPMPSRAANRQGKRSSASYFDDPQQVAEGRKSFLSRWGDRPLTDDWNRSQRPRMTAPQAYDSLPESVSPVAPASEDSLSRDFYLRQLPLTEQEQAQMRGALASALLQQAGILAEKLDLKEHAQRSYARLLRDFPAFAQREKALTESLLLALRQGDRSRADSLRALLLASYPQSTLRPLLAQTDYPKALRQQARQPERLYASAWEDYQAGELQRASRQLDSLFLLPLLPEELTPKARLLQLLLNHRSGKEQALLSDLQQLRERYPQSEVTPYINSLVKGLEQGRALLGLPLQQSALTAGVIAADPTPEDSVTFLPAVAGEALELLLLYPRGSAPKHEVYFTLMTFIFTHFTQWSIEAQPLTNFTRWEAFRLRGFRSEAESKAFLQGAQGTAGLLTELPAGTELLRLLPTNLPLLTDTTLPAYRHYLTTQHE